MGKTIFRYTFTLYSGYHLEIQSHFMTLNLYARFAGFNHGRLDQLTIIQGQTDRCRQLYIGRKQGAQIF